MLLKHLSAWRHGRGFGVHSPLAYDLISNILHDNPAYYGDAEINRIFATPRARRAGRIVLRLVAHFQPSSLHLGDSVDPNLCLAAKLGNRRLEIVDKNPDMAIDHADDGTLLISVHPTLSGADTGPLIIDNLHDIRIVIKRHGLSVQTINAKF